MNTNVRGSAATFKAVQALCGLDAVRSISSLHPLCQTRIPPLAHFGLPDCPYCVGSLASLPGPSPSAQPSTAGAWRCPRRWCRPTGRRRRRRRSGRCLWPGSCAAARAAAAPGNAPPAAPPATAAPPVCVWRDQLADQTRFLELHYPFTALAAACGQEVLRNARSRGATKCTAVCAASHCITAYVSRAFTHCAERVFRVHHPVCALADAMPFGQISRICARGRGSAYCKAARAPLCMQGTVKS